MRNSGLVVDWPFELYLNLPVNLLLLLRHLRCHGEKFKDGTLSFSMNVKKELPSVGKDKTGFLFLQIILHIFI